VVQVSSYFDESIALGDGIGRRHPMVVFGDHRLCAGHRLAVQPMPGPHMHSQVEINVLLSGAMTYWLDGGLIRLEGNRLVMFWGMAPHQVTEASPDAEFACFYLPLSMVLALSRAARLRDAVLRGGMIAARDVEPWEQAVFLRWRRELMSGDDALEAVVRDELVARLHRLDYEGWQDLRRGAAPASAAPGFDAERLASLEAMTRFIGDHGLRGIQVNDVAKAAGLHPNYAMSLFRRAFGITIKHALTRHRLDAAQSLLLSTDLSIAAIAFDCGFGSLSSFYEAFEKRFSVSPASFRKAMLTRSGALPGAAPITPANDAAPPRPAPSP
jgi:AraC family transcriptional regulator, melibiose operon regulatory protein